jgi:hypothetical protein
MPSPSVEERLSELEKQVARLLEEKSAQQKPIPWWERHFGAFKDSPNYDEAMRLGAEYRRSQPTAADENNDDILAGL